MMMGRETSVRLSFKQGAMTMIRLMSGLIVLMLTINSSHGFVPIHTTRTALTSPRTAAAATTTTWLNAVNFFYSPSSLQHLSKLEEPSSEKKSDAYSWSTAKTIAALGGIVGTTVVALAVQAVSDRGDFMFVLSGLGGALGWTLLGGPQVRKDDLPADGGNDGKFVVDRPSRLKSILQEIPKQRLKESNENRDLTRATGWVEKVHGATYLDYLKDAVQDAKSNQRLRRLVPSYARTLIDEYSYNAAVQGVADWIQAVDSHGFALVRPPSHHACKERGMGGCLLNGAAIAAHYALTKYDKVAILDIDAHFGNGIAHCIQDEPRLLYCSLHEDLSKKQGVMLFQKQNPQDPRLPGAADVGPLGNCLNVLVPTGANWDMYQQLLTLQALPFVKDADFLIVAAGFDALQADQTSGLCLQPEDYQKLGLLLKQQFGSNRVAFGLEGGYCWEDGELADAVMNLVEPF